MPVIRLVPSTLYNAAGTSYLTVSNPENAYTNTDSSTYATIDNTNKSVSSRYIYLRGFNFSSVPSNATVTGFAVKIKANESGGTSSSSYSPKICDNTTTLTGTCEGIGSSVAVHTFEGITASWGTIKGYGSDFGIRVDCKRNNKNTAAHHYIYGAEIEVTYTLPSDEPPVITVGTPSTSRISAITDHDQCVCTFTSDLALQQWEARATKAGVTPARGVGLLVESGGALAANTQATIYVENEELTQGDGEYTITVYGQSTGGIWSA